MSSARARIDPNKPLMQMSRKEMRDAFDEIGLGNTFQLLEEGRHNKHQIVKIAAAVLIMKNGEERLTHFTNEYGDRDGIRQIDEFVEEVYRTPGLLLQGEKLEARLFQATQLVAVENSDRRSA